MYYKAPSQEDFDDMKKCAIKIWETYDNTYGYVDEKVGRVNKMENVSDNFMSIMAMFDLNNQSKLGLSLQPPTRKAVIERMKSVGSEKYIPDSFYVEGVADEYY